MLMHSLRDVTKRQRGSMGTRGGRENGNEGMRESDKKSLRRESLAIRRIMASIIIQFKEETNI